MALQAAAGLYPDEGLARYEWRKHGVCSGKSPTDYFNDVRRARDAIVIPQPFQDAKADQTWTPLDIQRAFIAPTRACAPACSASPARAAFCKRSRSVFPRICAIFAIVPR